MTTPPCPSPPTFAELPEDIISDILKRLPVQTLVRFKCVCKSWHQLLTNPIFTNTHLNFHLHSPTRIILSRYFKPLQSLTLPLNPNSNLQHELHLPLIDFTYYIKGHCHGLLCLINNDGTIILYNPSISRYRTLPTPVNFNKTREVLGIGYDCSVNDYKIVRAPSSYCNFKVKDYNPQVEILCLKSNTWRKVPETETPPYFIEHYQQSIYLNGAVYWLTLDDFCTVILRFDLSMERFSSVPPPEDVTGRNIAWIGVMNDSLCVIHSHRRTCFDIWATRDDLNWEKLISVSKIVDPEPCLSSLDYAPLYLSERMELLMNVRGKGLVVYDSYEGRYKEFDLMKDARWLQETVYTDSLIFPLGPLDHQTGYSSSSAFKKMLIRFCDAFMSLFICRGRGNTSKMLCN